MRAEDLPGLRLADACPVEEPVRLRDGFHRARGESTPTEGDDGPAATLKVSETVEVLKPEEAEQAPAAEEAPQKPELKAPKKRWWKIF